MIFKTKLRMIKNLKNWTCIFGLLLIFTSCLDQRDPVELPPAAHVLFYHASPDAPNLDVYVENTRVNTQPLFYTSSIPYRSFGIGERFFRLTPFNAFNSLLETTHTFEADKIYSMFITNDAANLSTLLVEDRWSTPASGTANLRSVHLSPDLGDVTIRINREEREILQPGSFKVVSDYDSLEIGIYTIEVISAETNEVLVSANNVQFQNGRIYTLVLRGFQNPGDDNRQGLSLQLITNHVAL